MKKLLLSLFLVTYSASAQSSPDGASNSFLAALETVGARQIYVYLTIAYPDTAVAEDYIDASLLRQDVTSVVQNVPNKTAPLEVFAAAALNALYGKYPQTSSIVVQVLYLPQTLNQQSAQAQRTRPAPPVKPPSVAATKK